MKKLQEYLIAEAKKSEAKQVPIGWRKGSTQGRISNEGLEIIRQFLEGEDNDGETFKYSKRTNVDLERVRKNMKLGLNKQSPLGDILGRKGIMNKSSAGAKRLQLIFRSCQQSGAVEKGLGGYVLELNSEWSKLANTEKSSEKILKFWVNTLYNVYKQTGSSDRVQLKFFFKGNLLLVDEPSKK